VGKSDNILKAFGPSIEASCGARKRLAGCTPAGDVLTIPTARICADPDQPRKAFDAQQLRDLAGSMKAHGQLQPVRVRYDQAGDRYILVVGERRWRAAILAGLPTMTAVVDADDGDQLEKQLTENLLRGDLRPVEEAAAFRQLMDAHGWTAAELADRLKVSAAKVSRSLALLDLPPDVQVQVDAGGLKGIALRERTRAAKGASRKTCRKIKVRGGVVTIILNRKSMDTTAIVVALQDALELIAGQVRKAAA